MCTSLRRNAKEERVLFHYNGHGVPRPTANGEIWVFNKVLPFFIHFGRLLSSHICNYFCCFLSWYSLLLGAQTSFEKRWKALSSLFISFLEDNNFFYLNSELLNFCDHFWGTNINLRLTLHRLFSHTRNTFLCRYMTYNHGWAVLRSSCMIVPRPV